MERPRVSKKRRLKIEIKKKCSYEMDSETAQFLEINDLRQYIDIFKRKYLFQYPLIKSREPRVDAGRHRTRLWMIEIARELRWGVLIVIKLIFLRCRKQDRHRGVNRDYSGGSWRFDMHLRKIFNSRFVTVPYSIWRFCSNKYLFHLKKPRFNFKNPDPHIFKKII